jgi:hypothetical protein
MALYLGNNQISLAGTNGGFGLNGHLLLTKTYSINLGQTNYSSLTPSTTSQNLTLPATTYSTSGGTTITCFRIGESYDGTKIDFNGHDYVGFAECVTEYNYGANNVFGTIHPIRHCQVRDYQEGRYDSALNTSTGSLSTSGNPSQSSSYISGPSVLLYQKADNTYTFYASGTGIYHSGTSAFSWSTSSNYIDLKLGTIAVVANASYAPVAALTAVNPANTTVTITWYLYECDKAAYGYEYSRAYELAANEEGTIFS